MVTAYQFVADGLVGTWIFAQLLRELVVVVTSPCPRANVGFKAGLTGRKLGEKGAWIFRGFKWPYSSLLFALSDRGGGI